MASEHEFKHKYSFLKWASWRGIVYFSFLDDCDQKWSKLPIAFAHLTLKRSCGDKVCSHCACNSKLYIKNALSRFVTQPFFQINILVHFYNIASSGAELDHQKLPTVCPQFVPDSVTGSDPIARDFARVLAINSICVIAAGF